MANDPTAPLAFNIPGAVAFTGLNRSALYRLVGEGRLTPRKVGRRTLFLADELRTLVQDAPPAPIRRLAA